MLNCLTKLVEESRWQVIELGFRVRDQEPYFAVVENVVVDDPRAATLSFAGRVEKPQFR
ncbi:hypothetical protein [Caballeronia catudaia]|uniref:hypothetical protein n=1 Tax=Caballeronia catudaia TaxID=1777136 RepID=UPI001358079C|nr:hypothetical protein [Caballeronia catudaia]